MLPLLLNELVHMAPYKLIIIIIIIIIICGDKLS